MPSTSSPPTSALATGIDAILAIGAAGCWTGLAWLNGTAQIVMTALAASLSTLALLRPWLRRHTRRATDAAALAAERQRERVLTTATRHAEVWRTIVDNAMEGIITIDAKGDIQTVNSAAKKLFGYQGNELIGINVSKLMPEPHRNEHDGHLARYMRTGQSHIMGVSREVIGNRKDGSQVPIDLTVGEGTIDGQKFFTAVIRDISERKDLQTKLAQAERLAAVGELAAGVAHEINNPTNTMINCAQLIHDGDDTTENADIIIEEGGRIADIVRALLQFARDDRDRALPTSLQEAIESTMSLIGENWTRHGITVTLDIGEDLPLVLARPQKVQQILLNLMINAKDALVQHDVENRHVALTAQPSDGGVELRVSDNGPGIDAAIRNRLFEPFITTKRALGGTGLGLSVARSILDDYGGTIDLIDGGGETSEGAEFVIWLPLAPAE